MKKNMKKIVSTIMAVVVLLATQISTPAYAAPASYDYMYLTATKVTGTTPMSAVYNYKLSINNNKLIATGVYNRTEDPSKFSVQLQITKPVTTEWRIGTNGLGQILSYFNTIQVGQGWELKSTINAVRSTSSAGNNKISMEIDLVGLADGVYNLQEVITKSGKKEGNFGGDMLLVVHKGVPSLQTASGCAYLTQWWHDTGFYTN